MYATAADLVIAFGAQELAEVATPKRFSVVDAEDLEAAIDAGSSIVEAEQACLDAIDQALTNADSLIDSYLGTRYTLPLASTPAILTERALDIARYELQDEAATEETRDRYKDAIAWLKDIVANKATLGDPDIDSGSSAAGICTIGPDRTFNSDTLATFVTA